MKAPETGPRKNFWLPGNGFADRFPVKSLAGALKKPSRPSFPVEMAKISVSRADWAMIGPIKRICRKMQICNSCGLDLGPNMHYFAYIGNKEPYSGIAHGR